LAINADIFTGTGILTAYFRWPLARATEYTIEGSALLAHADVLTFAHIYPADFRRTVAGAAARSTHGIGAALAADTVGDAGCASCRTVNEFTYQARIRAVPGVFPVQTSIEITRAGQYMAAAAHCGAQIRTFIIAGDRAVSPPVHFFAGLSEVGAIRDACPGQAASFIMGASLNDVAVAAGDAFRDAGITTGLHAGSSVVVLLANTIVLGTVCRVLPSVASWIYLRAGLNQVAKAAGVSGAPAVVLAGQRVRPAAGGNQH